MSIKMTRIRFTDNGFAVIDAEDKTDIEKFCIKQNGGIGWLLVTDRHIESISLDMDKNITYKTVEVKK